MLSCTRGREIKRLLWQTGYLVQMWMKCLHIWGQWREKSVVRAPPILHSCLIYNCSVLEPNCPPLCYGNRTFCHGIPWVASKQGIKIKSQQVTSCSTINWYHTSYHIIWRIYYNTTIEIIINTNKVIHKLRFYHYQNRANYNIVGGIMNYIYMYPTIMIYNHAIICMIG